MAANKYVNAILEVVIRHVPPTKIVIFLLGSRLNIVNRQQIIQKTPTLLDMKTLSSLSSLSWLLKFNST